MMKGNLVTAELVSSVRSAKDRFPDMTQEEIARFCGSSRTTVGKILNGQYEDDGTPRKADPTLDNSLEGELGKIRTSVSGVSEQIQTTRNMLNDALGIATMDEVLAVLVDTNRMLSQIAYILCNWEDPSHVKQKNTSSFFRDQVRKYTTKLDTE